jgi:AcrR family transcriptional regulator
MAKGEETRRRILERAVLLASRAGLEGLSIGELASDLGLSKSGLFAHFGSKEDLQVAVLDAAVQRFEAVVSRPALRVARGEARMRALIEAWIAWVADPGSPGGCIFLAAATELDDREGKARDFLVGGQRQLIELLTRSARGAIEQGDFRKDLDCEGFAFECLGLILAFNHYRRLMRDRKAEVRVRAAFERLLHAARA